MQTGAEGHDRMSDESVEGNSWLASSDIVVKFSWDPLLLTTDVTLVIDPNEARTPRTVALALHRLGRSYRGKKE